MRPHLLFALLALSTLGAKPTKAEMEAERRAAADKVVAAADPAATPPLLEPIYKPVAKTYAWLGAPGGYYPDRAAREGSGGAAVIQCKATSAGRLKSCKGLAEAPVGWWFEAAALRMAEVGHLTVAPDAGAAEDRPARVIVIFPRPGSPY